VHLLTRWTGVASTRVIIAANGGRRPFMFVAHSFRTRSTRGPQIARSVAASDSAQTRPDPRRVFMQFTKILGLAAVGAVLALASPANAVSLSNPGAAAAVQEDVKPETTEVHWRHRHHHHHHHRWHRWHRHHHHHHHRHWRRS
jgi:hypothetical protein